MPVGLYCFIVTILCYYINSIVDFEENAIGASENTISIYVKIFVIVQMGSMDKALCPSFLSNP